MKRILFEFEDLSWFPDFLRRSMTDYLRYFLNAVNFYKPITPLLADCLKKTESNRIIDLCSGGGGYIETLEENLKSECGKEIPIVLTDKFPNIQAYSFLKQKSEGIIDFQAHSVDAMQVPVSLEGVRTIFSGFHHFNEEMAEKVLADAVKNKQPIAVFDGGDKNIFTILGIIVFHPIAFILFTPFFRPFRLSRIIFTYFIPLIQICAVWDGCVSILRLYQPKDLLKIATKIDNVSFEWNAGKVKNSFGMKVTYLIGSPVQSISTSK